MLLHVAVWSVLAVVPPGELKQMGAAGTAAIEPQAISALVRFLSDDLLEGRLPGTRGHALAERFVAAQMAAVGLEPAGEGGTFFQPVPMRATHISARDVRFELRGQRGAALRLLPERDLVLFSSGHEAEVAVDAPLVFAAFGVTPPEYGYDDLAGLDLRGKVAVVLFGAPTSDDPAFFPPTANAWYTRMRDKVERLRARGAVGLLLVRTPAAENIYPWAKLVRAERTLEGMEWLDGDRPGTWPEGFPLRGSINLAAFDRILAFARRGTTAAQVLQAARERKLAAFDLGVTARVRARARFRPVTANNVVGLLRGSDPSLSREVVVYSAHLDHLGVGEPSGKDAIYNGAVDNASGVAGMLAVARAFGAGPRPGRSVLFVAVTAEEAGYSGSAYFARKPTVPRDAIVADLNLDVLTFSSSWDVVARGEEHSTLGAHVRAAADALGLPVSPDPQPEQVLFIRSDQLNFVREGIPSVWIQGGMKDEHGETAANLAAASEYRKNRYHQPSDEWTPALDFESMARIARAAYLTGLSVAASPERPRWNEGDFFARFAARGAAQAR